ncbi:potassium/sodium hyperpolarization-activated cyclic nucleotide-gated channel 4 [Megachile rotundata]|uniref:potassium/sodium hyperpolarization-activated cyclic nucleotide-gated channel 4 n=1 Tax=Megachile rotundata TaxID=143995 RepID=UPI000258E02C|nr:PREDICTED: potassium/sodium hyperpolarization-activated cyclic nucleotide-gated channel 2-like [Megachile rotundata]
MLHVEHQCELSVREVDILFVPGRGPFRKIFDFIRLSLIASRRNPAAQKYLRSSASIVYEKRRHLRHFPHIIHPFSMFRHFWNFLMIFMITSLLLLVPYQATFEMIRKSEAWIASKNFLLLLCCVDIVINFFTGYFDKEEHGVVLDQHRIVEHYIKSSTFIPDFIGSFPTDLFFVTRWQEYMVIRKTLSLICVFRVFSLGSYIDRLAFVYDLPIALYEFCKIVFWLLMALHWQSCFHWLIPIAAASMYLPQPPKNDSWIHAANLWDAPRNQQYLASTLRAIATFLRGGLLHSNPRNVGDIYLIIIMQLIGIVSPWFLITRVMQYFKGANSSRLRYQGTVAQLRQYMRHKQLPYPTQRRIIEYYEFRFQHRFFRESEIIHTLSSHMRNEISMHSCRKLVENVTFFNNLPLSLLSRIVSLLRSEIFLTNDVIVRANQTGDCMYFIGTGTVAIYTDSGKEVCHLEDGAHFGEVALVMPDEMRVASVIACEVCELYRLNRADFARTIHPYPMLWERIKKIAIERHEKTMILNAQ